MADQYKKQQTMTPDEVAQAINGTQGQPNGTWGVPNNTTNPYGNQGITPITPAGTPGSAAWRDVKATGKAATDYQALLGAQPGSYQSRYQTQMDQTLNQLLNPQPYRYDVNTDVLYQQLKDNAIKQSRRAMMDVQGQSSALTGGYGNTYGVVSSQQAGQDSYDSSLIPMIPQLAGSDYQKHMDELAGRRATLEALRGMDESEYQRYQYDTQQYEQKLADAYQKFKASQGGRGSGWTLDKYMSIVYGFYGTDEGSYSSQSGMHGDAGVDAAVAAGTITKQQGDWIKQGGRQIEEHRREQEIVGHIMGDGAPK